ncbi:MAG: caspase family protein [Propylenella sp.]
MIIRAVGLLALAISLLFTASQQADARRIALVIGNDAYAELPALRKAGADAADFAALLDEKGFDQVLLRRDLTGVGIDLAVSEFLEAIAPGDTAVFFYSGHGWSDGGQNFLVGTDVPKTVGGLALSRLSVPLQNGANGVIDEMARRGAALKVVVVDACRDNPFVSNVPGRNVGLGRGLTRVEPPNGTFVVFSAGAGQVALDRLSDADAERNSVFTRTFLPLLRADQPLLDAVKTTQGRVYELARLVHHEQEPAYYDQVRGDACLSLACREKEPTAEEATANVAPAVDESTKVWLAIQGSTSPADYKTFLDNYPESSLAPFARKRLASIEPSFWESVATSKREADLHSYLDYYPDGAHAAEVRAHMAALMQTPQDTSAQPDAIGEITPELTSEELIVAVQEALKRVGCYSGAVDGDWGPRSQRALEGFLKRRNVVAAAEPSSEVLGHIKDIVERVCPLEAEPKRKAAVARQSTTEAATQTPSEAARPVKPKPQNPMGGIEKGKLMPGTCSWRDAGGSDPRIPVCGD